MNHFGVGTKLFGNVSVDKSSVRHVGSYDALVELARSVQNHNLNGPSPVNLHFPVGELYVNGKKTLLPIDQWERTGFKSTLQSYKAAAAEVIRETLPQLEKLGYSQPHREYLEKCLAATAPVA